MSQTDPISGLAKLSASNIGGIDETEVSFSPGITILSGRNTTNRTSLLQAVMAALGSDDVSLKGDSDEGTVKLEIDGETYTRSLMRENGVVVTDGDPYLDDSELADLFAFLLESNEARQAVTRKNDLRELIMRPVDTHAIQAGIEELEDEKRQLDDRIRELNSLEQQLPAQEEERARLGSKIEEKKAELEEAEARLEVADADVQDSREQKEEIDEKFDQLDELRNELEDVRHRIEIQQDSLEALQEEYTEVKSELESIPESPDEDIDDIDAKINQNRGRKNELESTINELQTVIQFNEEMFEDPNSEVLTALTENGQSTSAESLTGRLVEDDTVVCWTCGSKVENSRIENTLDQLRDLRQSKLAMRSDLSDEIDELQSKKEGYEEEKRRREELEQRHQQLEDEIDKRTAKLEDLKEHQTKLTEQIKSLEAEVKDEDQEDFSEVLSLHKQVNQLEFEVGRLEQDLRDVSEKIEQIEEQLREREELEKRRKEVQSELQDLRTRIDQIESKAIEQFNDHMEIVLDLLDYANIDRIWIERTKEQVREGRRKVSKSVFDLHIIRSTESGVTYEDTIDHLSESEREVTGLVFGLAGYLVHDVHEKVPFILLDSLEAIDATRIATLVEHFDQYADYLLVALLSEDAAALDEEYERLTDI